jgi:hypothetical protein
MVDKDTACGVEIPLQHGNCAKFFFSFQFDGSIE